jgi:hypothetical protein
MPLVGPQVINRGPANRTGRSYNDRLVQQH